MPVRWTRARALLEMRVWCSDHRAAVCASCVGELSCHQRLVKRTEWQYHDNKSLTSCWLFAAAMVLQNLHGRVKNVFQKSQLDACTLRLIANR